MTAQLFRLNRADEALPLIEEVVDRAARLKVQPDLIGLLNNQRTYYKQSKNVAGCTKTAELWEKLRRTDPRSLYNAACYRAVTAGVIRDADRSPMAAEKARAAAEARDGLAPSGGRGRLRQRRADAEGHRPRRPP